ncbi:MAG: tetratricopeptide repeat protein [Magnetococcales bacterium]|nr:tetratricopeptide repeat protein [Magnetococcales bacterium]
MGGGILPPPSGHGSRCATFAAVGRFLFLLPLLGCALLVWASLAPPALAGEIDEIQTLLEKKQLPAAMSRLDTFLKTNPKDAQARFLKGLILTEEQKQAEAIQVFQELTEEFPDRPEPFNNLAVLYAEQGQLEKARDVLIRAINSRPGYATARENLGDVYAKLASQAYKKALQINRGNPETEAKLALVRTLFTAPGNNASAAPPARLSEEFLRKARNDAVEKVRAEAMDKLKAEAINQVRTELLEQVRADMRQKLHTEILAQVQATEMGKIRAEALAQVKNEERERIDAEAQEKTRASIEAKARAEKEKNLLLEQQAKEKQSLRDVKTAPAPASQTRETREVKKETKEESKEKAIKDEAPAAMKQLTKGQVKTPDQAVRMTHMTKLDQVFEAVEKEDREIPYFLASPKRAQAPESVNQNQETQAVEKAIRSWAAAWSEKQLPQYLAAYAKDFRLPDGFTTREEWSRKRKHLVEKAKSIHIGLDDLRVRMEGPGVAKVNFIQSYRSNKFNDVVHKSILMKKEGDTWKILQEGVDG